MVDQYGWMRMHLGWNGFIWDSLMICSWMFVLWRDIIMWRLGKLGCYWDQFFLCSCLGFWMFFHHGHNHGTLGASPTDQLESCNPGPYHPWANKRILRVGWISRTWGIKLPLNKFKGGSRAVDTNRKYIGLTYVHQTIVDTKNQQTRKKGRTMQK